MKILALNGSPRPIGNTSNILNDMQDDFEREGVEFEIVHLYEYQFANCNVCLTCEIRGDGRCMDEDDGFNALLNRMRAADGIVLAAPTYSGACPSVMQTFLERAALVLEKSDLGLRGKVGGAVAVYSHQGGSLAYNQMVGFLLNNGMLVAGSNPLPIVRALNSPQYLDDKSGMKGVKSLVANMTSALMRLNGYERSEEVEPALPGDAGLRGGGHALHGPRVTPDGHLAFLGEGLLQRLAFLQEPLRVGAREHAPVLRRFGDGRHYDATVLLRYRGKEAIVRSEGPYAS
ncbi:MAG: flavodoxin family protein, partial [Candidatus Methanomethylophilaceae archaeon]|nr:flavodoxin family protein [Candidatus Methanomethylophilaceae archaeon]